MRLHVGCVPGGGKSKGQSALIFTEHREVYPEKPGGPVLLDHAVVHVERQSPLLEVVRDRILEIAYSARDDEPCFFVDASTGLGAGLVKILSGLQAQGKYPPGLHRPHSYTNRGVARQGLVNAIVEAYGSGRLKFAKGLPLQHEMMRALETYQSQVADDGKVSYGGDEEMVIGLGLSLAYPRHGAVARYVQRDGSIVASRLFTSDQY